MKSFVTLLFMWFCVLAATGCATAGLESRPGDYHVNGYTTDPERAIEVSSHAYVEQYNAETYRRAVESGRAYAYPGGGYGNDYWFHYRRVSPSPPRMPARGPAVVPPGEPGVTREDLDAVREETEEARERADEALRLHNLRRRAASGDEATDVPADGGSR